MSVFYEQINDDDDDEIDAFCISWAFAFLNRIFRIFRKIPKIKEKICINSHRVLGVSHVMRYINLRYLLTYLFIVYAVQRVVGLRSRRTEQCGLTIRTSTRSSSQAQWSTITCPTMFSRLWRRSDNDLMSLSLVLWSVSMRSLLHSACVNKLLVTNLTYHGRCDIALASSARQITARLDSIQKPRMTLFPSLSLSVPFIFSISQFFSFPWSHTLSILSLSVYFSLPLFSCCEVGYTEYAVDCLD